MRLFYFIGRVCGLVAFIALTLPPGLTSAEKKTEAAMTAIDVKKLRQAFASYFKKSEQLGLLKLDGCGNSDCQATLNTLFRASGLYAYPVPAAANFLKIKRGTRECYQSAGTLIQVNREKGGALLNAVLVQSRSPKAMKRLVSLCKQQTLQLKTDKKTNLESLAGLPVGVPTTGCQAEQGLFVRRLNFNNSRTNCRGLDFIDNTWIGGFNINEQRCRASRGDLDQVWNGQIAPNEFADRERKRQFEHYVNLLVADGQSRKQARANVQKMFQGGIASDVMMVGSAMRNIEMCNLINLGVQGEPTRKRSGGARPSSGKRTGGAYERAQ